MIPGLTETVSLSEIKSAAERIRPWVVHPPLLESPALNRQLGCRVLFQPECLQRTGAFKARGAFHFLLRLSASERAKGVVAYSSGNHAQAVAYAAQTLGSSATIVMPADAPRLKIEGTRCWGAQVVLYDRLTESREAIAQEIQHRTGAILVPPYDHPWTMMGQGTVALEMLSQWQALSDASLDAMLVPTSGGGLVAGCGVVVSERSPKTALYAVEPSGYDDTRQSLAKGERVALDATPESPCDALLMSTPGELTFALNRQFLSGAMVVSEQQVFEAMRLLFLHLKLVVEPGGAVGLAAILANAANFKGKSVAVVLSGGNVDPALFAQVLQTNVAVGLKA